MGILVPRIPGNFSAKPKNFAAFENWEEKVEKIKEIREKREEIRGKYEMKSGRNFLFRYRTLGSICRT